jgi:twitching motility two-component system response regulator PilH
MVDGPSRKVLVVDDEPDAVEFVRAVMEDIGLDVVSAGNGADGIAAARAEAPDLIVLDVQMPGMDGFTVFSELRRAPELAGIPVVMLTGVKEKVGIEFSAQTVGEFVGQEPDAYIEKPIDPGSLQDTARRLLGL